MKLIRIAAAALLSLAGAGLASAEDVVGKWKGNVMAQGAELPMQLVIAKGADGKLSGTAESLLQAPGMLFKLEPLASDGANLSFGIPEVPGNGSYAAKWSAEKKAWIGIWTQNGIAMQLDLARAP